ncbi:hypothetical protein Pfo_011252 [Paulownia fortunei]|nr:hypothetical protein Pfo_011252 [Paulownia fortunei]
MFLHVCLTLVCSFAILFLLLFLASNPETAHAARSERVVARNGVVATDETECSKIGRDILRRGGHAVDAAVATTLCLGVVSPCFSGLGGGGFMLVRSSSGNAKVFDMREMAPRQASKDMFGGDTSNWKTGPLSIAVPGQLAGLYTAHKQYGKIPWEALVKPAENLARKGFSISQSLFKTMASAKSIIMADKELRSLFAPNGELLLQGKTLHLTKLADTLAAISKHGMNIFYNGSMAQSLAEDIQMAGGIITKEDFQKYRVIPRKPLVAHVLGYQMVTVPPPASGGAMIILILKILSNYKATGVPISLGMHRLIEALKYALALRMNLGDPGFVNVTNVLENMTSTSYAKKLKNQINDNKTFDSAHYGSKWSQLYDHGTTHVCIIDGQRNVVTMTISLNSYFGSKVVSPSTGIFLNNQMYDFSIPTSGTLPPSPANFIRPFKRPLSSMAPTIFVKGRQIKAVVGAAGGLLIPDAVTQVLINHLNLKMDPLIAVRVPRFYHMLYPNVLYHEDYKSKKGEHYSYHSQLLDELKKKGHVLRKAPGWTVCQFVIQKLKGPDSGQLIAVSDQRKGGFPAGY